MADSSNPRTILLAGTPDGTGIGPGNNLGDRFDPGAVIGVGGMGEVRAAVDQEVGRPVAIKQVAENTPPGQRRILIAEARLQGRLDHPAIPPVYDLGVVDGRPAFAMRRVTGATLGQHLANRRRDAARLGLDRVVERLLRAFVSVCHAVDHAHQRGVAHCDLKPGNIMLDDDDRVYVIDWGVATTFGDGTDGSQRRAGGTLGYMAPEQLDATVALDGRADVYALGCILFEILAGEPLHPRGDGLLQSVLRGAVDRRPSQRAPDAGIPPALDRICERATHQAPADRYPQAAALADDLTDWIDRTRDLAAQTARAEAHHQRAREAARDPTRRAVALAEAGRALALAPDDADVVALVRDLLAGDDLSPGAEAELAAINDQTDRRVARAAAWSHLGFLLFPVALLLQGGASPTIVLATLASWAALEGLALAAARGRGPRAWPWWSVGLLVVQSTLYARYLGPFTIAPAIGALACAGALLHPRIGKVALVVPLLAAPALVALLLEWTGAWSRTLAVTADGITLGSAVSAVGPTTTLWTLLVIAVSIQLVGAAIGHLVAAPAHAARRQLAAQVWHLEQLVGASARGGGAT
ncbi:MAG: serine/threonine-protein kinase [Kofleriaceae bacterium]